MKAKYIQKGDAVDYIPNQDMDAGEIVCLGDLIGITRIPIKAGTLGTLTLSGVFDIIKQAGVTFSTGDSVCWNSSSGSAALELFLALPLKNPALTPNTSECF